MTYNGEPLEVKGPAHHTKLKSISFKSCDKSNPGILVINATYNHAPTNSHCFNALLLVKCHSTNPSSAWNEFKTDYSHWKVNGDEDLCSEGRNTWLENTLEEFPHYAELLDAGAKNLQVIVN